MRDNFNFENLIRTVGIPNPLQKKMHDDDLTRDDGLPFYSVLSGFYEFINPISHNPQPTQPEEILHIQAHKTLSQLQKEYKNVVIRQNLELICTDVRERWEASLCSWDEFVEWQKQVEQAKQLSMKMESMICLTNDSLEYDSNHFHGNSLDSTIHRENSDIVKFQMVRGDGNCFYRAFAFSLLCSLRERGELGKSQFISFIVRARECISTNELLKMLNKKTSLLDLLVNMEQACSGIFTSKNNLSIIEFFNNEINSIGIVLLMRFLTALFFLDSNNASIIMPFLGEQHPEVKNPIMKFIFCSVLKQGVEAEEIQIHALSVSIRQLFPSDLSLQLCLYHVDNNRQALTCVKYPPTYDNPHITLFLLFRPGHYDSIICGE